MMKVGFALVAAAQVATVAAYVKPHFKVYNKVVQFGSAVRNCVEVGGSIAHVHTRGENDQLNAAAAAAGVDSFWLAGIRTGDTDKDVSWSWTSDGITADSGGLSDFRLPDFDGDGSSDLWAPKEPNNYRNEEDCIKSVVGKGWNDARCWSKAAYACWFQGTTTTGPPTTSTTFKTSTSTKGDTTSSTEGQSSTTTEGPTSTSTQADTTTTEEPWSPLGFSYYPQNGCWYRYYDMMETADAAALYCQAQAITNGLGSEAAFLATPQNEDEAKFISTLDGAKEGKPRWVGGHRSAGDPKFSWNLALPVHNAGWNVDDWGGWYASEPSSRTRDEVCVAQGLNRKKFDTHTWKMNDAPCNIENKFVCQYCVETTSTSFVTSTTTAVTTSTTPAETSTTTVAASTTTAEPTTYALPEEGVSGANWKQSDVTGCYYIMPDVTKRTFDDAVSYCSTAHVAGGVASHLATVSSEAEARFVYSFDSRAGRPKWVGSKIDKQGNWRNIDSTHFSHSNFYPGEPRGDGTVAQMGYNKKSDDTMPWLLNDVSKNNKNRFVCEWCAPELATSTTTMWTGTTTTTLAASTTTTLGPSSTTTPVPYTTTSTTKQPFTTTSTTRGPYTTTTSAEPPCTVANADLNGDSAEMDTLVMHIQTISSMSAKLDNRKTGRVLPVKWSCEEYCQGLAWGPSCAPCGLHTFKHKEGCLFPGPFLTGDLCHRNSTSGEVTDIPCCNKPTADAVDGYEIAEATTCLVGNQCKCNKYGRVDKKDPMASQRLEEKFAASYMYELPRVWKKMQCWNAADAP